MQLLFLKTVIFEIEGSGRVVSYGLLGRQELEEKARKHQYDWYPKGNGCDSPLVAHLLRHIHKLCALGQVKIALVHKL